ncbi:carbohydrate kinase [Cellulomonas sp. DKR-3]|uniref:Carbohydrate kinase n=1 Tax=Cellulomonas fulva TaxID=2835530 RepID=A0ABS5TUM2_9CELL|nr:carbohydrate kinase [Cellulomonas fulva]MBT0992832.1 carbohydrate kinase [Cellulomonas fulva]
MTQQSDQAQRPDERALVIGEALIDVVERADGTRDQHPGGSPANVALGLGRLGRAVELLTWLGEDAEGDLVRHHLRSSHVDVLVGDRSAIRTPIATAHLDNEGVATYEFDLRWDLPSAWEGDERVPLVVHTGSIATVLEPGAARVAHEVARRRPSSTVTYDPNLRPALMGSPEHAGPFVDAMVRLADVVKVSDEDLAWLHPGVAPAEIAEDWARRGPALVVVTHGGEGAFAATAAGARLQVAAPSVQVLDTVGAGDSFMGGLIDGLWTAGLLGGDRRAALHDVDAGTVEAVLERCARIAAITVSREGANPPRSDEL